MSTVRTAAVVGCGMIGRTYARVLPTLGVTVVAAVDPRRERAAELVGADRAYGDVDELLGDQVPDLVCVCSPTPYHRDAVVRVADRVRHVFLEKPMAKDLAEARAIASACTAGGVVLGMGFKMRFERIFARIHELVSDGAVGEPQHLSFTYVQPVPPGERIWYADLGIVRDMLVHPIDLASWYFGAVPRYVRASAERRLGRGGEDRAWLDLRWEDGRRATLMGAYLPEFPDVAGRHDLTCTLVGDRGYVTGARPDLLRTCTESGVVDERVEPVDAFSAELSAYVDALATEAPPPVRLDDGLAAQSVVEATLHSIETGEDAPVPVR